MPPPGLKRLSYLEQREWEQMEEKIMVAETNVEARQKTMDDPSIAKDHLKLSQACKEFENAQQAVQQLYARWEFLEAKQK